MKNFIKITLVLLLTLSCKEKVLNVVLPFGGSEFVLFTELSPNATVSILVERTYPPTGTFNFDTSYLGNCKVKLFEDNIFIEALLRVGNSNKFRSPSGFKPVQGKAYHFLVSAEGFPDAENTPQIIPEPFEIVSRGFSDKRVTSPNNPRIPAKLLEIELAGSSLVDGFIIAEVIGMYQGNETSSGVSDIREADELTNPCMFNQSSYLKFYDVRCLNEDANKFSFIVELNGGVQGLRIGNKDIDQIRIKFSKVNKFYFDFYKKNIQPSGIERAFELTRKTLSNVNNGYGAVLSKNEVISFIDVPL